jgi:hypothetical protein
MRTHLTRTGESFLALRKAADIPRAPAEEGC